MTRPSGIANLTAIAVLRGALQRQQVAAALAALRGRKTKALVQLAARLLAAFGAGRRPRRREVAAFLDGDAGFQRVARSLSIGAAAPRAPSMQPAAGAPRTWRLPEILTPAALARWLQIGEGELQGLCASWRTDRDHTEERRRHYHCEWIPRRRGPPRLIEAPKAKLKTVQRRILGGILDRIPPHPAAHGFVRGHSTISFVAPHAGKHCVLRMDVEDFFASIRRARVLRVFLTAGYPERIAAMLADLCTTATPRHVLDAGLAEVPPQTAGRLRLRLESRHLPQGAPTSPALANLCSHALDLRLSGLARKFAATYTRYADDLLFSGGAAFARDAARCEVYAAAVLLETGLDAAHRKTRIMRRSAAQRAAGLVINARPAVPRRQRELLEAILVNCVRRGVAAQNRDGHADFRAHLLGRIACVAHVHPGAGAKLRALFEQVRWQ